MKTLAILASAATALSFATAPLAQTTTPVAGQQATGTSNANCFGQARSEGAKANQPMGQVISKRAQAGTNAEMNAAFKESCQTATPPTSTENNSNCFGQARSEGAKANQPMGQVISKRAQAGTNAEMNAAFKEACQTTPTAPAGQ